MLLDKFVGLDIFTHTKVIFHHEFAAQEAGALLASFVLVAFGHTRAFAVVLVFVPHADAAVLGAAFFIMFETVERGCGSVGGGECRAAGGGECRFAGGISGGGSHSRFAGGIGGGGSHSRFLGVAFATSSVVREFTRGAGDTSSEARSAFAPGEDRPTSRAFGARDEFTGGRTLQGPGSVQSFVVFAREHTRALFVVAQIAGKVAECTNLGQSTATLTKDTSRALGDTGNRGWFLAYLFGGAVLISLPFSIFALELSEALGFGVYALTVADGTRGSGALGNGVGVDAAWDGRGTNARFFAVVNLDGDVIPSALDGCARGAIPIATVEDNANVSPLKTVRARFGVFDGDQVVGCNNLGVALGRSFAITHKVLDRGGGFHPGIGIVAGKLRVRVHVLLFFFRH